MEHIHSKVTSGEQPFSVEGFCLPDIISPSLQKGKIAQTHYFFKSSSQSAISLQVDLKGEEGICKADCAEAKRKYSIASDKFPYGQTEFQWWEYCLAPHSYLPLNDGKIQVGLNFFNRFLHIDFN